MHVIVRTLYLYQESFYEMTCHSEKGGACNLASRNSPAEILEDLNSSVQLHTIMARVLR